MNDNATNGDVIKAMFPDYEVTGRILFNEGWRIVVKLYKEDWTHDFDLDWWNAPYTKEQNNEP